MTEVEPILKAHQRPTRRGTRRDPSIPPWTTKGDCVKACVIVDRRSGGRCEAVIDGERCGAPATNHHHVAGRGFPGCHHPGLLAHLCGQGNVDGCHGHAHTGTLSDRITEGLRYPWGTTVEVAAERGWLVRES